MTEPVPAEPSRRRVLVTGAGGFIGRHTLPALSRRGFDVHAVSCRPRPRSENVTWHVADLLDPGACEQLLEQVAPTHLLHLAWYTEPGAFWTAPENVLWLESSLRLLRVFAANGGRRMVGAGTCAEYDWSSAGTYREATTPLVPSTLYGECKRSLHAVAERLCEPSGMPSLAWGRIFFLYGPHEQGERLVPSVVRALLEGREALCTDGHQKRDFMHSADVAGAFVALLDSDIEGPLNIASGDAVSIAEVVSLLGAECGRPELVRLGALPTRAEDPEMLVADVSRLRNEVGFSASRSLQEGLVETVAWWREQLAA